MKICDFFGLDIKFYVIGFKLIEWDKKDKYFLVFIFSLSCYNESIVYGLYGV